VDRRHFAGVVHIEIGKEARDTLSADSTANREMRCDPCLRPAGVVPCWVAHSYETRGKRIVPRQLWLALTPESPRNH
jgi:hypothetical protein